jgi:multicomponent Na+:H+ antiporter subunit B
MKRKIFLAAELLLILACALVVAVYLPVSPCDGESARDYFFRRGLEETGAPNLVSGIYLRYRNYDTLGETLLLFLVISGVTFLIKPGGKK